MVQTVPIAGFIFSNFSSDPLVMNIKKAKENLGSSFFSAESYSSYICLIVFQHLQQFLIIFWTKKKDLQMSQPAFIMLKIWPSFCVVEN